MISVISGNRFRNRVKEEINNILTQSVLVFAEKGLISLDVKLTPSMLSGIVNELKEILKHRITIQDKEQKKASREKKRQVRELEGYCDRLMEYDNHPELLGERDSRSKTAYRILMCQTPVTVRKRITDPYGKSPLQYGRDYYVCPTGQHMNRMRTRRSANVWRIHHRKCPV